MVAKALKDYKSSDSHITPVNVTEDVETLAQKISRFAPKHFPSDGVNTYQIAIMRIEKGYKSVPYGLLILVICKNWILRIFTDNIN